MIVIKNKKCSIDRIRKEYPDCVIIDVTSKAKDEFIKLSPFYPHDGIPVEPCDYNFMRGASVEGIWQGLKVFENEGWSFSTLRNQSMKKLKRSTRVYGRCLGHAYGDLYNDDYTLLNYIDARKYIYIPAYKWMLENKCSDLVNKIRIIAQHKTVILLDYNTNEDIENSNKPLSHAALIKKYINKEI
jgi:hypothetical protein